MTADQQQSTASAPARRRGTRLDSLGTRLLLAFVAVASCSVLVLTIAALLGTDQGLASAQRAERQHTAERAAQAAATAHLRAGGWAGADLSPVAAIASAAEAQLTIQDATGAVVPVTPGTAGRTDPISAGSPGTVPSPTTASRGPTAMVTPHPTPPTTGGLRRTIHGQGGVTATVLVNGAAVGTVRLAYGASVVEGRHVAWNWVIAASVVALVAALCVSWLVTQWLTRPLGVLAATAQAFARGDRSARARLTSHDEIGAVGSALDHLADEVVRSETIRRRMAADVAHEIRTPLAALQAGLEELRDGLADPGPSRLAALHNQALRLGRVVDDLASLSSAEAAALSLRRADIDLADVAERALAGRSAELRAAGLLVTTEISRPLPVHADADRVHQAICNLLANAARYCRPDDSVTVRATRDATHALVEIADTGPGIEQDDLPHIFERLRRGRASHAVAGSGIGLAVVRELITAHGGTVTVTSPSSQGPGRGQGPGSTFTIRLPLSTP